MTARVIAAFCRIAAAVTLGCALLVAGPAGVGHAAPDRGPIVVYIVEHGEPVFSDPALPLSANGIRHGKALHAVLRDVKFTNVYSSSALRSKQTVSYTADPLGLPIVQLPDGDPATPTEAAVEPIVQAVTKLPAGSTALVGGNTENIYRIINKLGIPVVQGCGPNQQCVPCSDKTCFTENDLNSIWRVTIYPAGSGLPPGMKLPTTLDRLHTESPNIMVPPRSSAG
ncbi:histidine phosphatase family protein [Mycolicibacterium sp. HK-90]|uniref:histidine phosphatase family protein n=1 Tax=Mycolicibacterium sp. HK-90 TaxID=3056937 RepID=UPI00265860C3|nr:histidine phosphatase family protein [Mycolicibacterium sp. HK-90]WKG05177.1 histidine phosphatase family protein [Mycolicibacterium sp. HK-90]